MKLQDRIKKIRTDQNMSQTDFAKALLVSRSAICKMESGENLPSEQTKELMVRAFGVSKAWLEREEGDPYAPLSRSQVIADFCAELLRDEEESFRRRFIEAISDLSMDEWKVLEKISNSMQKKS